MNFASLLGGIAVDSNGVAYVSDAGNKVVDAFSPNFVLPKTSYQAVTNQTQTSGTLNATIDPNGGGSVLTCVFQYGPTASYGSSVPCTPAAPYASPTPVHADVSGLTTETPYHYRVLVTNTNGTKKGSDQIFLPHAVAGLTTLPPTNVARTGATLNATFNGNGQDTHYFFEWGTSTEYGNTTAVPPGLDAGSAAEPTALSFALGGLQVETTYHYRVIASNAAGTSTGGDQSFTTTPAVAGATTGEATEITATTAKLNGSYIGNGEDTHFYFEWGPTSAYGHTAPAAPGTDDGSVTGPRNVSLELPGLGIDTSYHYRLVASNAVGTTHGFDKAFTTLGTYEFAADIGTEGGGDGQLLAPKDVAVDNATGDIYVADTGNNRIVKFDSAGSFLATWGEGVDDGGAAAEVCTSGCQAGIAGTAPGEFTAPRFVEVDNSGGASAGDVYVADGGRGVVQKFGPGGQVIGSWGEGGKMDFSTLGEVAGITVGEVGDLTVASSEPPYYWTTIGQDGASRVKFATANRQITPLGTGLDIDSAGTIYETTSQGGVSFLSADHETGFELRLTNPDLPQGVVVDRSLSEVYASANSQIASFTPTTNCSIFAGCPQTGSFGDAQLTSPAGLAINSGTHALYAADAGAGRIVRFSRLPVPAVTTGGATRGETSATLSGHIDPGSGTVSSCYFQYGVTAEYELGTAPCQPATPIGAATDVTAEISGLTPFTSYHYRLVGIRADGKGVSAYGQDRTVTPGPGLLPGVSATASTDVTETSATLSAEINPNLAPTIYRFEYGLGSTYGQATPAGESIGEDGVDHAVSTAISGLSPGTTYHFRVLAINLNGTAPGPDMTFTTPGGQTGHEVIPPPPPPPPATQPPPAETQPSKCKKGFVKRNGRCVKQHRKGHHGNHGRKRGHHG